MKYYFTGNSLHRLKSPSFKFLLVMKLTVLLLLAVCFQVSAKVEAQTVTYSAKNVSLERVLNEITKQTGYEVLYNSYIVRKMEKLNIKFDKTPLRQALDEMFKGCTLTYSIVGNIIVIREKSVEDEQEKMLNSFKLREVHGTVVDASTGKALIGVTVRVKGGTIGTTTDVNGNFSLDVPNNSVLEVSFLGYTSKEVVVNGGANLKIVLSPTATGLNQLVVVAYGTEKKSDLTGSVVEVSHNELQAVPNYNVANALQGRASGVQVNQNSGAPGDRIQITVRGGNSMIGNNEPLYVVDGFPVAGGIDFLNPANIESISILKDASATALYGARGANGVVIITTKQGIKGQKNTISVSSYYGIQQPIKEYKLLTPAQYAIVANEWLKNSGQPPFFNIGEVSNQGTNWEGAIFRKAPVQNHTLTFSGSTAKSTYSISGNYYKQEGIIINSGAQRGSVSFNFNSEVKNWLNLAINMNLSRREIDGVPVNNGDRGNNVFSGALSAPPTVAIFDSMGIPTRIGVSYPFTDPADLTNPMVWSKPYKDATLANTALVNSALTIKFTKELSLDTRIGLDYENSAENTYSPIIYTGDKGRASSDNTYWNSFLNENILTYKKDFGGSQQIIATGGVTYQTYMAQSSNISVIGFSNNITENYNLGAATTTNPPSSSFSQWKLLSGLARVNYSYADKYLVTASIRADGSSRFGADNKWGMFPSGAVAWRISEEPFMKENISFINNLKIRASYGMVGNTAVSPYQSLDRLSTNRYIYGGATESVGEAPSGIPNSSLRWETTNEMDLGADLGIFNDRISLTFDYYNKRTHDLLASVPLAPSTGFRSLLENLGEIQNQGIEFEISAKILTNDVKWRVDATVSTNKNKVLKLAGRSDIISSGVTSGLPGYNLARVGLPLGVFYGYVEDGLNPDGTIKYVDENKDGAITPLDQVILGSPYPKFIFGFNSNLSYKNFSLNIFLQGTYGNDIFWRTAYTNLNSFQRGDNQLGDLFGNYWTAKDPNPHAKYPIISPFTQMTNSNRFIKNGSYLRLKSLELSYNIPVHETGIHWIQEASIYVQANNLLTITNYPGLDPDVNTLGSDSGGIGNRLQIGTDETGYPSAKMVGAGINLSF